jgi:hypothetical protein
MDQVNFIDHLKSEITLLEEKLSRLEDVISDSIFHDLSVLKLKVAVLEERSITNQREVEGIVEALSKLRDDIGQLVAFTHQVKDILDGHVIEETKDRVLLFRGILVTIFTVILTALVNWFATNY